MFQRFSETDPDIQYDLIRMDDCIPRWGIGRRGDMKMVLAGCADWVDHYIIDFVEILPWQ